MINTGDEVTSYELSIGYLESQQERRPGEAWFSFSPARLSLQPGESHEVAVGIDVPASALPGDYFALLKAQTVAEQTGGTSVGVAAATKLSFSVASSGWLDAQWHRVNRWLDDAAPWTYLLPAALFLAFLALKAGRLPFRLRIERR